MGMLEAARKTSLSGQSSALNKMMETVWFNVLLSTIRIKFIKKEWNSMDVRDFTDLSKKLYDITGYEFHVEYLIGYSSNMESIDKGSDYMLSDYAGTVFGFPALQDCCKIMDELVDYCLNQNILITYVYNIDWEKLDSERFCKSNTSEEDKRDFWRYVKAVNKQVQEMYYKSLFGDDAYNYYYYVTFGDNVDNILINGIKCVSEARVCIDCDDKCIYAYPVDSLDMAFVLPNNDRLFRIPKSLFVEYVKDKRLEEFDKPTEQECDVEYYILSDKYIQYDLYRDVPADKIEKVQIPKFDDNFYKRGIFKYIEHIFTESECVVNEYKYKGHDKSYLLYFSDTMDEIEYITGNIDFEILSDDDFKEILSYIDYQMDGLKFKKLITVPEDEYVEVRKRLYDTIVKYFGRFFDI